MVLPVRRIDLGDGHRGHKTHRVNAFLLDQLEDLPAVEAPKNDVLSADERENVRYTPAVGVKQGNRVKLSEVPRSVKGQANMQGMEINISVRQHDAFGIGAGAAGVKKFGHGVLVNFHDVCLARWRRGEKIFITVRRQPVGLGRTIEQEKGLNRRQLITERIDQVEEFFFQKEHLGTGIIQYVSKLVRCKPHV